MAVNFKIHMLLASGWIYLQIGLIRVQKHIVYLVEKLSIQLEHIKVMRCYCPLVLICLN